MRNVIVTGASRGLGLAITRQLASDGFRVVAVARNTSPSLDALIADSDGAVLFRSRDLADIDGLAGFVRQLRADAGPIWGLINNAGLGTAGLLTNLSQTQIEALIRLNTVSPIMLTKFVVRGMMAQGEGRIVNMSSIVAGSGFSGLSVYSATKASLIGFTKALSREVGRVGVTVNAVSPGFIDTDLTGGMEAAERDRVIRRSALRRLAETEDVAGAVSYLLSERARNVTGTVMTVDAGSTA